MHPAFYTLYVHIYVLSYISLDIEHALEHVSIADYALAVGHPQSSVKKTDAVMDIPRERDHADSLTSQLRVQWK